MTLEKDSGSGRMIVESRRGEPCSRALSHAVPRSSSPKPSDDHLKLYLRTVSRREWHRNLMQNLTELPKTQRAWLVHRRGSPSQALRLTDEAPVPQQLPKGEVLVHIHACALNPLYVSFRHVFNCRLRTFILTQRMENDEARPDHSTLHPKTTRRRI